MKIIINENKEIDKRTKSEKTGYKVYVKSGRFVKNQQSIIVRSIS